MKIIIVLGPVGSGKGTQAKMLVKKFGLDYFGSGESLRECLKDRDFTGKKLFKVMKAGVLVPSFVISELWTDKLKEFHQKKDFKGFVSDGTPRKLREAEFFNEALEWYNWDKNVDVVYVNISEKESFSRLKKRRMCARCGATIPWIGEFKKIKKCDKCGGDLKIRNDDKLAAIKKRMEEFRNEVIPVIDDYKKKGKLVEVNGEQSIEGVFKDICDKLKARK